MKVSLDIVITHYNEPFEIVKLLLDSIQIQRNVDFQNIKVYIIDDGKDNCVNPKNCKGYSFEINFIATEHSGVSNARNVGFEAGNSDYVMFCDCDDTFYHVNALNDILQCTKKQYDIIINNFYEEVKVNDTIVLLQHKDDEVFVHGKIYNRNFLIANNLKFNKLLVCHEDYYFNKVAMTVAKTVYCIDNPFYLWCTRDQSICRKDSDYLQKTYIQLIDVNASILEKFIELGFVDDVIKVFVQFVYNTYFQMCTENWQTSKYLEQTEKYFKKFFCKYRKYYEVCPVQYKKDWYQSRRANAVKDGMLFEPFTFLEWIKKILEVQ